MEASPAIAVTLAGLRAECVLFDLNGTLLLDEQLLFETYRTALEEHGGSLTEAVYFEQLAGLDDHDVFSTMLKASGLPSDEAAVAPLVARRLELYQRRFVAERPIRPGAVELLHGAAERVPVLICTGALLSEADFLIDQIGVRPSLLDVLARDHVLEAKPDPEIYHLALRTVRQAVGREIDPGAVVVFEDSVYGAEAAKAAGMRCIALTGTAAPEALAHADRVLDEVGTWLMDDPLQGE